MEYRIVKLGATQVMGIEIRTTNENLQMAKDLPPFWGRFYKENIAGQIPHKKTGDILGLYCEYERDHTAPYTLVAGCEVSKIEEVPEGMVVKNIPPAQYAVFETKGSFPKAMIDVWEWVWQGNLRRTFIADFELYPPDFSPSDQAEIDLFIGID